MSFPTPPPPHDSPLQQTALFLSPPSKKSSEKNCDHEGDNNKHQDDHHDVLLGEEDQHDDGNGSYYSSDNDIILGSISSSDDSGMSTDDELGLLVYNEDNDKNDGDTSDDDYNSEDDISLEEDEESRKSRKSSLIQNHLNDGNENIVFISFDLEHGGHFCGVTQISAVLFTLGGVKDNDRSHDVVFEESFNRYVKPPDTAIWDKNAIETTGLSKDDERIVTADNINTVWNDFCTYLREYINKDKRGVLVAWNGNSCDLEWIYKITQAPGEKNSLDTFKIISAIIVIGRQLTIFVIHVYIGSTLSFPCRVKYFLDPYLSIQATKSCQLNRCKSKIDSTKLSAVYRYIHNNNKSLINAHDSLVDAKAQAEIVMHQHFRRIFRKKNEIKYITDAFQNKTKKRVSVQEEPNRPVHEPWKGDDNAETWCIPQQYKYSGGSQGGGKYGPTNRVATAVGRGASIVDIFFMFITIALWTKIATYSQSYANEEFVYEHVPQAANGFPGRKKSILKPCKKNHPGARHRQTRKAAFELTLGFILAWHGIIIYHSAKAGEKESILCYWNDQPYGTFCPMVQNCMTRDAFKDGRRFLHLSDNVKTTEKQKRASKPDPLFKIREVIDEIKEMFPKNWIAGMEVCIDESMIKYKGRAITWTQYNPHKPIKHGIKVFTLTAAGEFPYVLGFEVYVGMENNTHEYNKASSIVKRLITAAGLTTQSGRILYTDNWYTSVSLARDLYWEYKWLFVGTIIPTEKKGREGYDIPFHKLSKGALRTIVRGWSRRATLCEKRGNRKLVLQVTNWRDKKQVMFLHTHVVEGVGNKTTKRYIKGSRSRVDLPCPAIQEEYKLKMNGVDRRDRDGRDNCTSLRTNRYYLRIWFWVLDGVIFCVFLVVVFFAKEAHRNGSWYGNTKLWYDKFVKKEDGRKRFQIDLGLALMEYGVKEDWKDITDKESQPKWMRRMNLKPCACGCCFHCKNGFTQGIYHKHKGRGKNKTQTGFKTPQAKRMKATCTDERVRISGGCRYCAVCYRTYDNYGSSTVTSAQKKRDCRNSTKGCAKCMEPVCKPCWATYDHYPSNKIG